jgi:hypothetical protein
VKNKVTTQIRRTFHVKSPLPNAVPANQPKTVAHALRMPKLARCGLGMDLLREKPQISVGNGYCDQGQSLRRDNSQRRIEVSDNSDEAGLKQRMLQRRPRVLPQELGDLWNKRVGKSIAQKRAMESVGEWKD